MTRGERSDHELNRERCLHSSAGQKIARIAGVILCLSLPAGAAHAQGDADDGVSDDSASAKRTKDGAAVGALLPFSHAASATGRTVSVMGLGGYDAARRTAMFESEAEVRVWRMLSLRGGAVAAGDRLRPSFGLRAQGLREGQHGVDGSIGVFYRPEGLTEPEGEVETVLSLGAHAGRTYLLANLVYGQDPEGRERDGEVRLAALRPVAGRLVLGLDGRLRFDLGSDAATLRAHHEARLDALIGPAVTVTVGPVALLLLGGATAINVEGASRAGAFVLGGLGAVY